MVAFAGSVQALFDVPAGGAAVSASSGSQSSAIVVTVPEDSYWLNSTYSQANLLSTFQQYLNDNVQGYPQNATSMASALGYGTWTNGAGYLCNEASGNLAAAFGAPATLTATSLTYGTAGPAGGIDKAIGFDTGTDNASGGDVFDVTNTDDFIVAWVAKIAATPSGASDDLVSKINAGAGWTIFLTTSGTIAMFGQDAGASTLFNIGQNTQHVGEWHVGIACIDRAAGTARIGTQSLSSGTQSLSTNTAIAATTMANADAFRIGDRASGGGRAPQDTKVAAVYVVSGSGVATGLPVALSTALTNFANAINAAWSVSLDANGRVTIANSHLPSSVAFTNTTLRNLLGFEYDFDYPQTAAQMATALGYGTWTSGSAWLCNESSGDLAPVFGSVTLADANTPTYSNLGPRGGNDKAVGFDSTTDGFTGGDVFDVTASDDLIIVWVGRLPTAVTTGAGALMDKRTANGWVLQATSGTAIVFNAFNGSDFNASTGTGGQQVGEWHVGIAVIDRGATASRCATRGLTSNTSVIGSALSISGLGDISSATSFDLGQSAFATAAVGFNLAYLAIVSGSGVASGLSSNISTALTNFATYMKSQTGTQQARGIWYPDCPLFITDSDPRAAPVGSDARTSVSGTGERVTHVGVYHRFHRGLYWSHVPIDRIREASATYANASFRTFWDDTQLARGNISWFRAGSSLLIVDHNGNVLGEDMQTGGPAEGWACTDPRAVEPKRVDPNGWTGLWRVEIPELIAKDE